MFVPFSSVWILWMLMSWKYLPKRIQLKNLAKKKKCHLKDQDSLEDLMADLCNGMEDGATEGKKWMEWRCLKCSRTHVLVLAQV